MTAWTWVTDDWAVHVAAWASGVALGWVGCALVAELRRRRRAAERARARAQMRVVDDHREGRNA